MGWKEYERIREMCSIKKSLPKFQRNVADLLPSGVNNRSPLQLQSEKRRGGVCVHKCTLFLLSKLGS